MDRLLKKLKETYSARMEDNPASYKYWKKAKEEGREELANVISRRPPRFVLTAEMSDGSVENMVDPNYGYESEEKAMKRLEKLLQLPGWRGVKQVVMTVRFGRHLVDRKTVYENSQVEIDERLSPAERRKKQVKNFGCELEWASPYDYHEGPIEDDLNSLVENIFGGKYSVTTTSTDGGISREFELTSDSSAALRSNQNEEVAKFIDNLASGLSEKYNGIDDDNQSDAEYDVDREDYDDEEEYKEAVLGVMNELESENFYQFLNDMRYGIYFKYGSDVASHFMNYVSEDIDDYGGYDYESIKFVLEQTNETAPLEGQSQSYGIEFVTPRLAFEEGNIDRLTDLFKAISELDYVQLHSGAGIHVHIGRLEDIHFIHLLRASQYLHENQIEDFALRKFNSYAESDEGILEILENLVTMNLTDRDEISTNQINLLINQILSKRYRTTNFSSISKGTVEFRLGSSELAAYPKAFEQYLNLIKQAIDYGVSEDYIEFQKNRFYLDDSGNWKIVSEDGTVLMTSKKGGKASEVGRVAVSSDKKRWKRFVQRFNKNEKLKKILMKKVEQFMRNNEKVRQEIFGKDGNVYDKYAIGSAYQEYVEEGGDLGALETLMRYAQAVAGYKDFFNVDTIFGMLKSKNKGEKNEKLR